MITLTISKANSDKLLLRPEPVKVSELFDAIVVPIAHNAANKRLLFCQTAAELRTELSWQISLA